MLESILGPIALICWIATQLTWWVICFLVQKSDFVNQKMNVFWRRFYNKPEFDLRRSDGTTLVVGVLIFLVGLILTIMFSANVKVAFATIAISITSFYVIRSIRYCLLELAKILDNKHND